MHRVRSKAHLILPSLARSGDEDRFEQLCADVEARTCLYFEGLASVLIVEIIHDDEGASINHWICGGDLSEVLTLTVGAEAWARGAGFAFASFSGGRKGWKRVMAPLGYAWNGQEFRKAL